MITNYRPDMSGLAEHDEYPHNPGELHNCPACEMMVGEIVFADGSGATEPLAILENSGAGAAIEYLSQWDQGGEDCHGLALRPYPSSGLCDEVYSDGRYVLSWNSSLGYIGLQRWVLPA